MSTKMIVQFVDSVFLCANGAYGKRIGGPGYAIWYDAKTVAEYIPNRTVVSAQDARAILLALPPIAQPGFATGGGTRVYG
jgi:hypothetical protein